MFAISRQTLTISHFLKNLDQFRDTDFTKKQKEKFKFCIGSARKTGNGYNDNSVHGIPQRTQPHIVLILTDDQGYNDVGWHNESIYTPYMDWLATHGVRLEQSYVQPLCTPSRTAILSGKYPFETGLQWLAIRMNQPTYLPRNIVTLPQKLKEVGYNTHMTGKWHIGHCSKDLIPTARGFDSFKGLLRGGQDHYTRFAGSGYDFWIDDQIYFEPNGSYNTDVLTDRAVAIIDRHDPRGSPLFMYIAYTTPRLPLQVPKRFEDLYPFETDPIRKTYLGMISSLDESIATVVDALHKKRMLEDSIIIFMSDNGGFLRFGASNSPFRGEKGELWEGGTKSVGFVYSPKHIQRNARGCKHQGLVCCGKKVDTSLRLIHAVDWYPTILDMARHPKAKHLDIDGVSQWNFIQQCRGSGRNEFVYNIDFDISNTAAIRVGKYKLIVGDPRVFVRSFIGATVTGRPADPDSIAVRLFDLKADPGESHDIAARKPKIVSMMLDKLKKYRQSAVPAKNPAILPRNITQPNGIVRPGWC